MNEAIKILSKLNNGTQKLSEDEEMEALKRLVFLRNVRRTDMSDQIMKDVKEGTEARCKSAFSLGL